MVNYEEKMAMGGDEAIAEAGRFSMREDSVHQSLRRITARLTELQIAHAVVGGMALVAHGYDRTTVDVDILVTKAGLTEAHDRLEGLGYQQPFEGSTQLRDTRTGVRIEFLITGEYP